MDLQYGLIVDKLKVHMGDNVMTLLDARKVVAFINKLIPFDCIMKKDMVYKNVHLFEIWTCSKRLWSLADDGASDAALTKLKSKLDDKIAEIIEMEQDHARLMSGGGQIKGKSAANALMSDDDD